MPAIRRLFTLAAALTALLAATADARVSAGDVLQDLELAKMGGGTEHLLARTATVNVVVFWRTGQDRSADTLRQLAACQGEFAGKPVHLVAVVSGSAPPADVGEEVAATGLRAPVLVDEGDKLYGSLEVRQHPLVLVADAKGKVVLAQPYLRLRYCEVIKAHVRRLLGEIDDAQLAAALHPARAAFPNDDKRNVARRYVIMGKREAADGHCEKAVASFDKALAIAPGEPEALAGKQACASARR